MKLRTLFLPVALAAITILPGCADKKISKTETASEYTLVCRELPRLNDAIIRSQVLLVENNTKETVVKTGDGNCHGLQPAQYAAAKVPADAIAVTGLMRMGGGDYYYLVIRNGKPVIYEGKQMVLATGTVYDWKEMTLK